jgi:Tol biopolymer transport system component
MDRKGMVEPLRLQPPGQYAHPRVSPDGTRVAFDEDNGRDNAKVYAYRLDGRHRILPMTGEGNNRFPIWASDSRIAFQSDRGDGALAVWSAAADGSEAVRLTTPVPGTTHAPEAWFGDTLLYSVTRGQDVSLWTRTVADPTPKRVDAAPSSAQMNAVFSPDGQWIAYSSTQQAQMTLFIQAFSSGPRHTFRANASDTPKHPRWSRAGQELCYNPSPSSFECARITTDSSDFGFEKPVDIPRKLELSPPGSRANYDIVADGRFVGFIPAGQMEYAPRSHAQIKVVVNWFEELKARLPRR